MSPGKLCSLSFLVLNYFKFLMSWHCWYKKKVFICLRAVMMALRSMLLHNAWILAFRVRSVVFFFCVIWWDCFLVALLFFFPWTFQLSPHFPNLSCHYVSNRFLLSFVITLISFPCSKTSVMTCSLVLQNIKSICYKFHQNIYVDSMFFINCLLNVHFFSRLYMSKLC